MLMGGSSDRTRSRSARGSLDDWSALPLGLSMAMMWWFRAGLRELAAFPVCSGSSSGGVSCRHTGVELPYCASCTRAHRRHQVATLHAARSPARSQQLVGLLLGACGGYGSPGYLAMGGRPAETVACGGAPCFGGAWPPAARAARPSGRTRGDQSPVWGGIRRMAASAAWWGCICCSGERAIDCAGVRCFIF